jgi:pimeloyl-ACP methyl ester carboxylesterase
MKAGIVELGCGVRIAYDEVGSGRPVLLVHGLSENRAAWDEVTPSLARDHRVIRIDLPSHGASSDLPHGERLALAESIGEFVRRLELVSPHLIGHSLGGLLVTLLAAPVRAASVVNVDQPFFMGPFIALVRELEPRLRGSDFVAAMNDMTDRMGGGCVPARVLDELRGYRAKARQDFVLSLWRPLLTQDEEAVAAMVEPHLKQIRCPYLALHGEEPGAAYREWLTRAVPTAKIEVWNGLGHWLHRAEPERFAARVREFLGSASAH